MNNIIQAQLDRIETALTKLIDSITSYNPSIDSVHELLSADDALTSGLDQLSKHQANHAHLLSLQETTSSLETNLTTTISTLAKTRAEILALPATQFTPSQRPIPASEVLDYAKNISRYTAPPSLVERLRKVKAEAAAELAKQQQEAQPAKDETSKPVEPDSSFTQSLTQEPTNGTAPIDSPFHPIPSQPPSAQGIGISALTLPEVQWLDPLSHAPFLPWPNEEMIRRSALASLASELGEQEPLGHEGAFTHHEGGTMNGAEEGQGHAEAGRMEENVGAEEGARKEQVRMMNGDRGMRREEVKKPAVFSGLDLYDPTSDQDDDD
jgi:hypothetical protein